MKHSKRRVSKIVDELLNYLFSIGATNINVNIDEETKQYIIMVKSQFNKLDTSKIDELIKCLNYEKQAEMEEYYWELTGENESELALLGMMVDDFKYHLESNNFELTLYRHK